MSDRDAAVCQGIVRAHARTFHLASFFLPPRKRRAAYALYAFCRVADDIVDCADRIRADGDAADESVVAALSLHQEKLRAALSGAPDDPVFRELHWVMREFEVPPAVLQELLDGVEMDLRPVRYDTWGELSHYCEGVASSVGEMCTYVFGVQGQSEDRAVALRYARTLGLAMQLTNILRDVGEDARRGRCYLATEDLTAAGIDREEILSGQLRAVDPRWQRLMRSQIQRAHDLYRGAEPGIALLSRDAQRCAWACSVGYRGILDALERIGCDSLTKRARLDTLSRMGVFAKVWRTRPVTHRPRAHPTPHWESPETTRPDELVRLA